MTQQNFTRSTKSSCNKSRFFAIYHLHPSATSKPFVTMFKVTRTQTTTEKINNRSLRPQLYKQSIPNLDNKLIEMFDQKHCGLVPPKNTDQHKRIFYSKVRYQRNCTFLTLPGSRQNTITEEKSAHLNENLFKRVNSRLHSYLDDVINNGNYNINHL